MSVRTLKVAKGMPLAVRTQLRLQLKQEEASRPIDLSKYSQEDKDMKSELDWIRTSATMGSLVLRADVAAITVRTTAAKRPLQVQRFMRDVWPRLIYANPSVRFAVHLHYDRLSQMMVNVRLEKRAKRVEQRIGQIRGRLQKVEVEQKARRRRQARAMGLSELEMQNVPDLTGGADSEKLAALEAEIATATREVERLRAAISPIERLDRVGHIVDVEAARLAALEEARDILQRQAEGRPTSLSPLLDAAPVLGPTTPKSVIDAVRAGREIDYEICHALEVMYPTGLASINFSQDGDSEAMAILEEVGLAPADPTAPSQGLLDCKASSASMSLDARDIQQQTVNM